MQTALQLAVTAGVAMDSQEKCRATGAGLLGTLIVVSPLSSDVRVESGGSGSSGSSGSGTGEVLIRSSFAARRSSLAGRQGGRVKITRIDAVTRAFSIAS